VTDVQCIENPYGDKHSMRIVFFGTPAFAIPTLDALLRSGEEVAAVVTQPDKKKGRTRILTPPPVKERALEKKIHVLQTVDIKGPLFFEELSRFHPEMIVVVAYGKILPPQILKLPPRGCVNVHASLLPKYRGAAPIQWAIIRGEGKTGITTMLMDEGLDTGDVLLQEALTINDDDNAETLGRHLAELGASLLLKTIHGMKQGTVKSTPQSGTPTYAPPLTKEDGKIDWSCTAEEIFNFVRGMYPWPCAYCTLHQERIKIIRVKEHSGDPGKAGRIEKTGDELIVGTGNGLISILELQPEGKRRMSARDFMQGRRLKTGDFFDEP
jgi:methionyl-tRNA formyltransferase